MSDEMTLPHLDAPSAGWTALCRFVFAYVLIYTVFTFSLTLSFAIGELTQHFVFYDEVMFKHVVPWVGVHILRLREPLKTSMSGDASFQWVEHFIFLASAILAAVVWSVLDKRRPDYRVLDRWLRLFTRLALATILFGYGFDKVFPNQFPRISRYALIQQFGYMNHFSVMWSFMGASKGYTIFSGLLEVTAGVLLLVPELATVGAFLAVTVMANVVALNLAYNVPVKLLSTNFLLMAVYLAAPELPRLYSALVRNCAVAAHPLIALSTNRRLDRGVKIAQILVGAIFFCIFFYTESHRYAERQKQASVAVPLQGIWVVDDFTVAGGSQSSLFTPKLTKDMEFQPGDERWSKLVFDAPGQMVIQTADGGLDYVRLKWNAVKDEAVLTDSGDKAWKADLKLEQPGPNSLAMQGVVNGLNLVATAHKMDESRFKIKDEGLHLVQPGQ